MRMPPYSVAAHLLEEVLIRLNRPVPDWVLSVVNENRHTLVESMRRCAPELKQTLDSLAAQDRTALVTVRGLSLWYELYSEYEDVDCAELTGRMERPASKLREECAAKKAQLKTQIEAWQNGEQKQQVEPVRRTFPIQSALTTNQAVPFELVLKVEKRLEKNHNQTAEMLARRGGLSWSELVCALLDLPLFSQEAERFHADEKLAFAEYRNYLAKHAVARKVANPIEALRAVLALFPADVSNDPNDSRIGFKPEFVKAVEDAREMLAAFDAQPSKLVWLNLEDGSFGESFDPSPSGYAHPDELVKSSDSIAKPLWKLIEFRCLNDSEFTFTNDMRLR